MIRSLLTDDALQRFRRGDPAEFRRAVEAHSARLVVAARSFVRDHDEALDLVQETWQRAYEKRSGFDGRGTLLGWLYAVCRTVCIRRVRRRSVPENRQDLDSTQASGVIDPLRAAEQVELQRSVQRALTDLPTRERDVVILRMIQQRSTRETAELLTCAEGTVKATLHHALKKLQISLEEWSR